MLHMATEGGGEFAAFLERGYDVKPSSRGNPWNLVLYADAIAPGSASKADNLRMIRAVYWSLLELGGAALAKELLWFVYTTKRSSEMKKTQREMNQVMKVMLEMFFSTNGHNIALAGIVLVTPSGRCIRIHVVVNAFVMDEAAHKEIWGCTGASGLIN